MDELLEFIGQEGNNIRIGFANSNQSTNRRTKTKSSIDLCRGNLYWTYFPTSSCSKTVSLYASSLTKSCFDLLASSAKTLPPVNRLKKNVTVVLHRLTENFIYRLLRTRSSKTLIIMGQMYTSSVRNSSMNLEETKTRNNRMSTRNDHPPRNAHLVWSENIDSNENPTLREDWTSLASCKWHNLDADGTKQNGTRLPCMRIS